MKKINGVLVAIVAVTVVLMADLSGAAAKNLPAGGGVTAACLPYGVEMRDGKQVKSCLLEKASEFMAVGGQPIACAPKHAVAFTPQGKVEYCTLTVDTKYRRTMTEMVEVKAGGRVAFYPAGTLEVARLKESQQLPYKKDAAVPCRGDAPISFRTDGNVAACILDQESLYVSALKTKKKVANTCQAGGLITFDEDGWFSGCYPPPPAKPVAPAKPAADNATPAAAGKTSTQGGQNQ
jgi:hypothetical protein